MKVYANIVKPQYHFSLEKGWINDPNGLVWFKGKYHLYFQCNPYGNIWDKMHWGHAISDDLMYWEECAPVLFPTEAYDNYNKGGCFSGSVIIHEDTMYAFYTGVSLVDGEVKQRQCLAYSKDGYNFMKYFDNPIIDAIGKDFRDPKVIFHDGEWQMLVGGSDGEASDLKSHGRIYLFHSKDLFHWEYNGILYEAQDGEGTMFECPDIFEVNGKWVITASPMNRTDFLPTIYMVGDVNFKNCIFCCEKVGTLDYGTHYYALQKYTDKEEKPIAIAWLGGWEWMPWIKDHGPSTEDGYRGMMSFPRSVYLEDNMLRMLPYGLEDKREEVIPYNYGGKLTNKALYEIVKGYEHLIFIQGIITRGRECKDITFIFYDKENHEILITLDFLFGNIISDFTNADAYSRGGRRVSKVDIQEMTEIDFIIFKDGNVLELFFAEGRYNFTSKIYPTDGKLGVGIKAQNAAVKYISIPI